MARTTAATFGLEATYANLAIINEAYRALSGPNPTDEQHDELVDLLANLWRKGMTAGQLVSAVIDTIL